MLSHEVEKIVEQAIKEAQERRHEFATVEHLCLVLFDSPKIKSLLNQIGIKKKDIKKRFSDFIDNQIERLPDEAQVETLPSLGFQRVLQRASVHIVGAGKEEVSVEHVLVAAFDEDESYAVFMMQQAGITRLDLVSVISHGNYSYEDTSVDDEQEEPLDKEHKKTALSRFTVCLTDEARKGRLDELIGREEEILRAMQVLCRRRKNNPLFVGDPGVGKTALAEGLAIKIVNDDVPEFLKGTKMYLIDMGAMLAGARYRGDFESRMKSVLKEIEQKKNAIMVIDEIHTIVGAGATTGSSMDASNLLKPILSQGKIRCIGSTTYKDYRVHFTKDHALERRFQKIDVGEPSEKECHKILLGIKRKYEDHHQVKITDEAVELAVSLAKRFIHERKLPDKAIDVIDEACARAKIANEQKGNAIVIDVLAVEQAVATMAHIPPKSLNKSDEIVLSHLKDSLQKSVFGQDEAIEKVSDAILMARAGLKDPQKPIGSFLFTGPSGVGKTEIARQLALSLGVNLIRFDMSEYMERHSASRLVGAPPGYVGFEQGGLLTDAVNKTPHAVLLLDEIEKAHHDVFNMLLQVMDYGKLTDSNGRSSDFRHVVLIMTSNAGARSLEQKAIGFDGSDSLNMSADKKADDKALKNIFTPEFRNRLDAIVPFKRLSSKVMLQVVDKFIVELREQVAEKKVFVEIDKAGKEKLAALGFDSIMGARPLGRIISERIKKPLARELLFGQLKNGGTVKISCSNEHLSVDFLGLVKKTRAEIVD